MWQPSGLGQTLISGGGYYRMGALAFSLGVQQAKDMNSYTLYSDAGVPNGTFTPSGLCGGLSVAYQVMDNLSVAGGVRYYQESLAAGEKDASVGVELSALYRTGSLTAGLALQNLLGSMMVRAGAGYSLASLDLSAEIDYLSGGGLMAGLGVQYGYKDMVFVRGGLHYGDSAKAIPSCISLGFGAKLFGVRLDAAYIVTDSALGNTLSAGLGYAF